MFTFDESGFRFKIEDGMIVMKEWALPCPVRDIENVMKRYRLDLEGSECYLEGQPFFLSHFKIQEELYAWLSSSMSEYMIAKKFGWEALPADSSILSKRSEVTNFYVNYLDLFTYSSFDEFLTVQRLMSKKFDIDYNEDKSAYNWLSDMLSESQQMEHLFISNFTIDEMVKFHKEKWSESDVLLYISLRKYGQANIHSTKNSLRKSAQELCGSKLLVRLGAVEAIDYSLNVPHKDFCSIQIDPIYLDDLVLKQVDLDDPIQLVMGHLTSCCQSICWAGSECCEASWTNPDASTIYISDKNGNILAQAYVWVTKDKKIFVLDNVEINISSRERHDKIKEMIELLVLRLDHVYEDIYLGRDYLKLKMKEYKKVNSRIGSRLIDPVLIEYSDAIDEDEDSTFTWNVYDLKRKKSI